MSTIRLTEIATPANPPASAIKLYVKTDGFLYALDSTGTELLVGSGVLNGLTITSTNGTLTIGSGVTLTAPTTTDVLVISGTAKLSVGTSTPATPAVGDLWVDTN